MSQKEYDVRKLLDLLQNEALKLLNELNSLELSEKERKWRYDALSKILSPFMKLLLIAYRQGEVSEEDLAKLLSKLSDEKLTIKIKLGKG